MRMYKTPTAKELIRFKGKIDIKEEDQCWEWRGCCSRDKQGNELYGQFGVDYKVLYAHRLSYEWLGNKIIPVNATGKKKDEPVIQHKCDNTKCVNPNHLELGTHKTNKEDMVSKNRGVPKDTHSSIMKIVAARGSNNGMSKLTGDVVKEIKELIKQKAMPQKSIASQYGISKQQISSIKLGRSWSQV